MRLDTWLPELRYQLSESRVDRVFHFWFSVRTRLDYYYVTAILSNLFFYISIWIILFHFLFWLIYGTVVDSGNELVCIFILKSSLLLNAKILFCHFLWLFLPLSSKSFIFFFTKYCGWEWNAIQCYGME